MKHSGTAPIATAASRRDSILGTAPKPLILPHTAIDETQPSDFATSRTGHRIFEITHTKSSWYQRSYCAATNRASSRVGSGVPARHVIYTSAISVAISDDYANTSGLWAE
jgi:hypothetical protein